MACGRLSKLLLWTLWWDSMQRIEESIAHYLPSCMMSEHHKVLPHEQVIQLFILGNLFIVSYIFILSRLWKDFSVSSRVRFDDFVIDVPLLAHLFTKNVFGYDEDGDSGSCVGFITSLPDDNNFTFTLSLHMMSVVVLSAVVEVQKLSGSEEQAIDFFKSAVKDVKLLDNSPTRTVSGGSYIVKFVRWVRWSTE